MYVVEKREAEFFFIPTYNARVWGNSKKGNSEQVNGSIS